MELIDILYTILIGALVIISIILIVIGIYFITILLMVKRVITKVDAVAFNILNIKSFAKIGAIGVLGKILSVIKRKI